MKNAEILKGFLVESAEILKGFWVESAEILKALGTAIKTRNEPDQRL